MITRIKEKISEKLKKQLSVSELKISDNSSQHKNHQNNKDSSICISITITSKDFNELTLLQRHQKVYTILKEEFKILHALELNTYSLLKNDKYN